MKTIRSLHLYLGCFFAPMLLFFALSGIWQTFFLHHPVQVVPTEEQKAKITTGQLTMEQIQDEKSIISTSVRSKLALLSTIHESRATKKQGSSLTSKPMRYFVITMALSFMITTFLGIWMALKFAHQRSAIIALVLGVTVPLAMILWAST